MKDMVAHQCTNREFNWSINAAIIGANEDMHPPLNKLYFYHKTMHFIFVYLSIYLFLTLCKG